MKRLLASLTMVAATAVPVAVAAASPDAVTMNQPFHYAGFDYTLTSVRWLPKTDPQAAAALKEPGCTASGDHGLLAFTFSIVNKQTGEGAGQMTVEAKYKDGTDLSADKNMGGESGKTVHVLCDAPKPTKADPIVLLTFGNGLNDPGFPKHFYLANPTVSP
jgi:hypothetical protein